MIQPSDGDGDSKLTKSEFWMRVAGASFALWALMIPIGITMIGGTFEKATRSNIEAASDIVAFNKRFESYVLNMERRITIIEERQMNVINMLNDMQNVHRGENYKLNGKTP